MRAHLVPVCVSWTQPRPSQGAKYPQKKLPGMAGPASSQELLTTQRKTNACVSSGDRLPGSSFDVPAVCQRPPEDFPPLGLSHPGMEEARWAIHQSHTWSAWRRQRQGGAVDISGTPRHWREWIWSWNCSDRTQASGCLHAGHVCTDSSEQKE